MRVGDGGVIIGWEKFGAGDWFGDGELWFLCLVCLGNGVRHGLLLLSCEIGDLVWGNDGRTI